MKMIGVFGGTFDPPHIAHLILASEAAYQLRLDRLLWILTPHPPHKVNQVISSQEDRLAMVRLAIKGNPIFELSTIDVDRPPPHYASDTMKILRDQFPGTGLVYVMGGDSLNDLPNWHNPGDFISVCQTIAVIRRPGNQVKFKDLDMLLPGLKSKVTFISAPQMEVSAQEIRIRVREGRPYRYFLTETVYDYIKAHSLYM